MLQSMGSERVRHDWATEQQHLLLELTSESCQTQKFVVIGSVSTASRLL